MALQESPTLRQECLALHPFLHLHAINSKTPSGVGCFSISLGTRSPISSLVHPFPSGDVSESFLGYMFPNEALIRGSFDTVYDALFLVCGSLLLSGCFLVKSLYLRWFKFEVASPYRRPINLKQTVDVSLIAYDCEVCSQVLQSNKVILMFLQCSQPSLFAYAV